MYANFIKIKTLTLKVTFTCTYKNANISETWLDRHIVTFIHRLELVYAHSFSILIFTFDETVSLSFGTMTYVLERSQY